MEQNRALPLISVLIFNFIWFNLASRLAFIWTNIIVIVEFFILSQIKTCSYGITLQLCCGLLLKFNSQRIHGGLKKSKMVRWWFLIQKRDNWNRDDLGGSNGSICSLTSSPCSLSGSSLLLLPWTFIYKRISSISWSPVALPNSSTHLHIPMFTSILRKSRDAVKWRIYTAKHKERVLPYMLSCPRPRLVQTRPYTRFL